MFSYYLPFGVTHNAKFIKAIRCILADSFQKRLLQKLTVAGLDYGTAPSCNESVLSA